MVNQQWQMQKFMLYWEQTAWVESLGNVPVHSFRDTNGEKLWSSCKQIHMSWCSCWLAVSSRRRKNSLRKENSFLQGDLAIQIRFFSRYTMVFLALLGPLSLALLQEWCCHHMLLMLLVLVWVRQKFFRVGTFTHFQTHKSIQALILEQTYPIHKINGKRKV